MEDMKVSVIYLSVGFHIFLWPLLFSLVPQMLVLKLEGVQEYLTLCCRSITETSLLSRVSFKWKFKFWHLRFTGGILCVCLNQIQERSEEIHCKLSHQFIRKSCIMNLLPNLWGCINCLRIYFINLSSDFILLRKSFEPKMYFPDYHLWL